jgi:lipopolysaccharide export system permease protein
VLTGPFQRHGGFLRPLGSVLTVVLLVALGLTVDGLAARDNALVPLIWLRTLLPGIVCAVVLFAPLGSFRRPPTSDAPPSPGPLGATTR